VLIIANYGIILYEALGMTGFVPLLLTSLWVTSTFPGNIFCAFFVEKFGRRTFLLIGLSGILVALICETALQATYLKSNNTSGKNAAIFFIFLFITPFWSTFCDATQFVYVSEIVRLSWSSHFWHSPLTIRSSQPISDRKAPVSA
jgi:MFS family permease